MKEMTPERYIGILRIGAILTAFVMWVLSIKFSVDGFNFNLGTEWSSFAGLALGFAVTLIQLVWNREANSNWTIMVVGLLAYVYGIYTNIEGILLAQNAQFAFSTTVIFPILLGLFLEVTPEALLVWGLTGVADLGDFFGNLVSDMHQPRHQQSKRADKPQQGKHAQQPQNNQRGLDDLSPNLRGHQQQPPDTATVRRPVHRQ